MARPHDPSPLVLLASPARLKVLRLVWDAERSAGDIAAAFDTTFGAVSQHLTAMRDAGWISLRKDGKRRLYKARRESLGPVAAVLEQMWASSLDRLAELAEQEERQGKPPAGRSTHAKRPSPFAVRRPGSRRRH